MKSFIELNFEIWMKNWLPLPKFCDIKFSIIVVFFLCFFSALKKQQLFGRTWLKEVTWRFFLKFNSLSRKVWMKVDFFVRLLFLSNNNSRKNPFSWNSFPKWTILSFLSLFVFIFCCHYSFFGKPCDFWIVSCFN